MTTLEKIGRNIALVRAEKKISQEDLAGETGIARNYISRIENGKVAFSVPVLLKIAKALNISAGQLIEK